MVAPTRSSESVGSPAARSVPLAHAFLALSLSAESGGDQAGERRGLLTWAQFTPNNCPDSASCDTFSHHAVYTAGTHCDRWFDRPRSAPAADHGNGMTDSKEKTILFVDSAPWLGGAQRSLLSLISGLRGTMYHPVLLAADHSPHGLISACKELDIPAQGFHARHWRRNVRGVGHYLHDRRRFRPIWNESVADWQPHLVHLNGPRPALIMPRPSLNSCPSLLHVRDVRLPRWLMRRAAARANRVIAVSRFTGCVWGHAVHRPPITVVPNGLEPEPGQAARPHCHWGRQHVKVLLIADMVPWKCHQLFLEALRTASLSMPTVRGVVLGRAHGLPAQTYLAELQAYARALDIHHLVQFVTDVNDAAAWIKTSDVLVSVADGEPFGRTVVEALRVGKPIVTTCGGGPEEIVSNCPAGTLVAPTAHDVARGIGVWLEENARTAVADDARKRADEYSVARMVQGVCDVYAKVLENAK